MSDALCCEHGLPVVERLSSSKTPRSLYLAEREGKPTRYLLMRQDIGDAISRSFTDKFFYQELQRMGYLVRYDRNRKYNTLQIPGTKHPTRFKTLGENYTEEAIRERILQNRTASRPLSQPPKTKSFDYYKSSFRGLYVHYCYLLSVIKENPHPHYSAALRADLRKLDEYSEQAKLLCRKQIDTAEQLQDFLKKTQEQISILIKERARIYKQISRCKDENQMQELVQRRDSLTDSISGLRGDLKSAKAVMERSNVVEEKLKSAQERNREIQKSKER